MKRNQHEAEMRLRARHGPKGDLPYFLLKFYCGMWWASEADEKILVEAGLMDDGRLTEEAIELIMPELVKLRLDGISIEDRSFGRVRRFDRSRI